jgi:electron transport complex protein RnfC
MAEHLLFRGGVHPDEFKSLTSASAIQVAPLLPVYTVPLQQHIGAPPKLEVKKGDRVLRGQLLASPGGFVSAAVHSPTSGTVTAIDEVMGPMGKPCQAVVIESDGEDEADTSLAPMPEWESADPDDLKQRIADAGIVGMGGAAFPTFVKLSPPPHKTIDALLINGAECEPALTADHRLMLEQPEKVILGTRILGRILGVTDMAIGIEKNKPDAIKTMKKAAEGSGIKIVAMRVRYPQGAEKQLIYALRGRTVPAGGLPMDVGAVVQNVGTAAAVAEAVLEGKPLYERIATITGSPVANPGNWVVRCGMSTEDALRLVGGVTRDPAKIISGGPMMGRSIYSLDIPVMKNTSGILLMDADEVVQYTGGPCIRCGRCVDACPMNLMPGTLSVQAESERFDLAEQWYAFDCIECGCCAYVCPSGRPLVQHMRRAKAEVVAQRRAAQSK